MIRRILGAAGMVAIAATAAQAQTAATFRSMGGAYNNTKGAFGSGATNITGGGFLNSNSNGTTNQFQIWCVDQDHGAQSGSYGNVWVTRLDGANQSETRLGAAGTVKYQKAAYIATGMGASGNNGQYAIWAIIHGKSNNATWYGGNELCDDNAIWPSGSSLSGCNASTVNSLMTGAGTNYTSINKSEWFVITDKNANGINGGKQEFIARCQLGGADCDGFTPPNAETPTPEPATMSLLAMGLAGMAGTSLRRRKK